MIQRLADYKFVDGDINGVIIDGGIMPLRQRKEILRGEDLCWCWERIREIRSAFEVRNALPTFVDPQMVKTWQNRIAASQWTDIRTEMEKFYRVGGGGYYCLKSYPTADAMVRNWRWRDQGYAAASAYSSLVYGPGDINLPIIRSGDAWLKANVLAHFAPLNQLDHLLEANTGVEVDGTPPPTSGELIVDASGRLYKQTVRAIAESYTWCTVAGYVFEFRAYNSSTTTGTVACCLLSDADTLAVSDIKSRVQALYGGPCAIYAERSSQITRLTDHTRY